MFFTGCYFPFVPSLWLAGTPPLSCIVADLLVGRGFWRASFPRNRQSLGNTIFRRRFPDGGQASIPFLVSYVQRQRGIVSRTAAPQLIHLGFNC
jgi:hypothetical protein